MYENNFIYQEHRKYKIQYMYLGHLMKKLNLNDFIVYVKL